MTLSTALVKMIMKKSNEEIPSPIVEKGELHIIDTLGISLTSYKGSPVAMKSIAGLSIGVSGGVAKVIGSENTLPPAYAAFANTALAHAMDFDDIHDLARIHPTPVILAAALAAGDVSEKRQIDLVRAVVLGNEVVCRLGYAFEPKGIGADANWFLSQLFGYIGAAVTAGLVLGLNEEQLIHAIGLAYMQAAGGKEAGVGVGSEARSIYPAFASMGGVQAALLASTGVTAPKTSLDGRTGLFEIYLGGNLTARQLEILLDEELWVFKETAIKLFPSCRYSHPYVQAALKIRQEVNIAEVKEIVIGVNSTSKILCEPLMERINPTTLQDAKFSIPFLVAFTLIYGSITLANLNEESLNDQAVLELAKRITIRETQEDRRGIPVGEIEVITIEETKKYLAHPSADITAEIVKQKFIQCTEYLEISNGGSIFNTLKNSLDYSMLSKLPKMKNDELYEINK